MSKGKVGCISSFNVIFIIFEKYAEPLVEVNNFNANKRAEGIARFDSKELSRHFNWQSCT